MFKQAFVYKLWKNLDNPIYGPVDVDPQGALIFCTYEFGSAVFDNLRLANPKIKWLGVNLVDCFE